MGIGGGLELRGDAGVVPGVGRGRRLELVSAEERYTLRRYVGCTSDPLLRLRSRIRDTSVIKNFTFTPLLQVSTA